MNDTTESRDRVKGSLCAYLAFHSFLILLPLAALWHRDLLLPELLPVMAFFSLMGLISGLLCLLRRINLSSALKAGLVKFGKHAYVFPLLFLLAFAASLSTGVGWKERDMMLLLSRASIIILGLFFLASYGRYVIRKRRAAGEGLGLLWRWNNGEIPTVIYCLLLGLTLLHNLVVFPLTALIVPFPLLFAVTASALLFEAGRNLRSFKDRGGNGLTWAYLMMGMLLSIPMRISLIELQEAFSGILPHRVVDVSTLGIRAFDLINLVPLLFPFGIVPGFYFKRQEQEPPRIAEAIAFGLLLTALLSLYLPVSYYAFPFIATGSLVVIVSTVNRMRMDMSAGVSLSGQFGVFIVLIGALFALVISIAVDTALPDVWILLNGYLSYWLLFMTAMLLSILQVLRQSTGQTSHLKKLPVAVWSISALLFVASLWSGWSHRTLELQDALIGGLSLKDAASESSYDPLRRYTWPPLMGADDTSNFRTHLTFDTDDRKVTIKRWSLLRVSKSSECRPSGITGVTLQLPSSALFGPRFTVAGSTVDGSMDIKTIVTLSRLFSSPILSYDSGQDLMNGGAYIGFKDGGMTWLLEDGGAAYALTRDGQYILAPGRQVSVHLRDCLQVADRLAENRVFHPDTIERLEKIDKKLVVRPDGAAVYEEIGGNSIVRKLPGGMILQAAYRIQTDRSWFFYNGWISEESLIPYDELIAQIREKRDADPSAIFNDPLHRYFNASGKNYLVDNYLKAKNACESDLRSGQALPYEPRLRMLITDPETTPLIMEKKPDMQITVSLGDGTLHTVSQGLTLQTGEELRRLNAALADDIEKWKPIFAAYRGESELWPDYPVMLMEYEQRLDCMVEYGESDVFRSLVISNSLQIHGIQYKSKMTGIEEKNGVKYAIADAGLHLTQSYYSDVIRTMEVEFCKQYAERMATEEEVRQYYGEEASVPRPGYIGYRTICIAR